MRKLLWSGRPRTDIVFLHSDWFPLAFVLALATYTAWSYYAELPQYWRTRRNCDFLSCSAIFAILLANIAFDFYRRRNVVYLITNQRVVVKNLSIIDRTSTSKGYDSKLSRWSPFGGKLAETTTIYFGRVATHARISSPNRRLLDLNGPLAFRIPWTMARPGRRGQFIEARKKFHARLQIEFDIA